MEKQTGNSKPKKKQIFTRNRVMGTVLVLLLIAGTVGYFTNRASATQYLKYVTGAPTLVPTGLATSGSWANLQSVDGTTYAMTEGISGSRGKTNYYGLDAQFSTWTAISEFTGSKVSKIEILLNGSVNSTGDTWNVQMWNYTTGAWDNTGLTNSAINFGTSPASYTVTTTAVADYLSSSNTFQVRIVNQGYSSNTTQTTLTLDQLAVRFTVDDTAPTASWVGPNTGIYRGTINLQATASDADSGMNRVEFWYKTPTGSWTLLGNGTANGNTYTYALDTTAWGQPEGDYNFEAIAFDNAGNSTTVPAAVQTITIDNTAPAVTSTNPANNQTNVSTTSVLSAVFSENVNNVSSSTFTLAQGTTQINGTVTYNSSTKTATFTPSIGLTNNTQYTATLSSGITDQAGNALAPYSWSFTTIASNDTQAPTTPGTPAGTGVNDHQIDLSWAASSDNVGVSGYEVWRSSGGAFSQIATTQTASYSDSSGLSPGTSYQYYVIAYDAAGNKSAQSSTGTASTTADSTPPSNPSGLTGAAVGGSEIDLSWNPATDNVAVTGYQIWRSDNGGATYNQITTSTTTLYNDKGLQGGTTYYYYVKAYDARGNVSGASNTFSAATGDNVAPSAPGNLTASGVNETQIDLSWTAATDNVGVSQYQVFRSTDNLNFVAIGTATGTTYSATGLSVNTTYYFYVKAYDAANNASPASNTASAKTPDVTAPTAPGAPSLSVASATQIDLSWSTSTDNVAVTGYEIYRSGDGTNFKKIGTSATNSYSDSGLAAASKYYYYVKAYDAAGNVSSPGGTASATTSYSTGPNIISATPPDGEINIATGTNIQAIFDQDMDPATITSTTFTVKPKGGAALTGTTVNYDTATRTATLSLTGGFSTSTTYVVTITTGVKNTSGLALGQAYSWSFTTASQPYRFPHGKYVAATSQCAACHNSHKAQGANLVEQTSIQATCYVCHNGTQASSNVQGEFNHSAAAGTGSSHPVDLNSANYSAGFLNCNSCHNPHGDIDPANSPNLYPRLLNTGGTNPARQGNQVCWTCHGTSSTYPSPNGDHQSTWPGQSGSATAAGTGHDSSLMNPNSGTQVKCDSCHQPHGSSIGKNLLTSITFTSPITNATQTSTVTGDNRTLCYSCHFDKYSNSATNDFWGQSTYEATVALPDGSHSNGHKGNDCQDCHNSHGSQWPDYLKNKYDMNASATRTTPYNQNDFQCTSCHSSFQNYTAPLGSTGTAFFNSGASTPEQKDLHYLHLQQAGIDGKGNAVCYECHRPHGAIISENSAQAHRVGFPAPTVTPLSGTTSPTYDHDPQAAPKTGGGCTLSCHGVDHRSGSPGAGEIDSRYNNSGAAAGASESSGGQACGSCHSATVNLFGTLSGGTITPSIGNYHHGITSDAAAYNDTTCLSCHVDHNVFSPASNAGTAGRAANLRVNGGNSANQAQTNKDFDTVDPNANGGLCLSCHQNQATKRYSQPDGTTTTPAISIGAYAASGHNYTVQSKFVSDGSIFFANCSKCHTDNDTTQGTKQDINYPLNPTKNVFKLHGSSIRSLLTNLNSWSTAASATPQITEPTAGKGLEENFCLKCHSGTSGSDMYGVTGLWNGHTSVQDILTQFNKAYTHPVAAKAGIHTPTEATGPGWNSGSNRHSECEDCHEPHSSKYNDGTDKEGTSTSMAGVWGVSVNAPYTAPAGGNNAGTNSYTYNAAPTKEYEVCAKCHSQYAWGTNPPASTYPGAGQTIGGYTISAAQPDVMQQFNPGNYATHPLFAPGANQPPASANPNWSGNSYNRTGTYTVNGTTYSVSGLDNTFTDGWGTKSLIKCADCHASDSSTDPRGPHGSTQQWILKKLDPNVTVTTAGAGVIKPNQHSLTGYYATAANDAFCLNCHRADVYGYGSDQFPSWSSSTLGFSRWSHGSSNAADVRSAYVSGSGNPSAGKGNLIATYGCLNCHGGGEAGGIHGSSLGVGPNGTGERGKRFMNGASWNGHTFGTTARASATCFTQSGSSAINSCSQHSGGTSFAQNYNY